MVRSRLERSIKSMMGAARRPEMSTLELSEMSTLELSAGTIEYQDTGGPGAPIVLLHGLIMDGSLWRKVVAELRGEFRCVLPTLPLGGHRLAMAPEADLSMPGIAALAGELIEALDLRECTLAMN